ncbi:MAG: HIT family protein [Chloroflexi bacterium]|nr:MAG: HIT family protein [Chloroflexota bacterium]
MLGIRCQVSESCLFCRIASGELTVEKAIETEKTIGVLNTLEPFARGHVVFFPKQHAVTIRHLPDDYLADMLPAIMRVATALGLENYNILSNNGAVAGQTVFHAHFHLIPKWSEEEGLVYRREPKQGLDHSEMRERLRRANLAGHKPGRLDGGG